MNTLTLLKIFILQSSYNLIEFRNNHLDTSGDLWQFKRDESPINITGIPDNVSANNCHHLNKNQVFYENQLPVVIMVY